MTLGQAALPRHTHTYTHTYTRAASKKTGNERLAHAGATDAAGRRGGAGGGTKRHRPPGCSRLRAPPLPVRDVNPLQRPCSLALVNPPLCGHRSRRRHEGLPSARVCRRRLPIERKSRNKGRPLRQSPPASRATERLRISRLALVPRQRIVWGCPSPAAWRANDWSLASRLSDPQGAYLGRPLAPRPLAPE
ncbi:hypothetical protein BS50DRAFT_154763 [Corynespora cassiicola Philippines]|uniref:Uncharacterized protein n=1 Tax=Corynespora cassiicola Philippines TaxID=1448308 RepID=A0A2T2N6U6_CORCC|nr:hypothetical protein BS50DRAFT_154763 [Corynespora cassiicola Philippines]